MAGYIGSKAVLLSTTAATVTGDAEITGDLTVGSNALFVDSTNNRVGVGTSSPSYDFQVGTTVGSDKDVFIGSSSQAYLQFKTDGASGVQQIIAGNAASGGNNLAFYTAGGGTEAERMRIDSSGNVGIGTSSPQTNMHIQSTGDTGLQITKEGSVAGRMFTPSGALAFGVDTANGTTERMRIDASGNVLVGTTDASQAANTSGSGTVIGASGGLEVSRDSFAVAYFNKTSVADGNVIEIRKQGTTVGSIGNNSATNGLEIYSPVGGGIAFYSSGVAPTNGSGIYVDNAKDVGSPSVRWNDIYATNGTIQTSDANEKQQIAELTAAEMQAAKAISKLFKTFKWNDSVAEKGDDARIHSGVIAQEVEAAMANAGLDAGRYAFFISTTWWEADGQTYETAEEAPEGAVERTRKGIRYPQLLAFVGAATEQRLASIEARLDALEAN